MLKKQVSLGRAVLCVALCVVFTALTTYQFCYYSVLSDYRSQLSEQTGAMKEEYDLLLAARDAQIAELESLYATAEAERAALAPQVKALTERMVAITGSTDGTAEDCLRRLLSAALARQDKAAGATGSAAQRQKQIDAYMEAYASDFLEAAERLLFIDYLYQTNYVGEAPSAAAAQEAMIEGYLKAAGDVFAVYYTPEEYLDFTYQMSSLTRCGIGIASTADPAGDAILVLHVHQGSPAMQAGLLPGDRILAVDGQSVSALGYTAAASLIGGEAGTAVTLTVDRAGEALTATATRRVVETDTVIARTYEAGGKRIGYIRLLSFNGRLAAGLREAYEGLVAEGIEALVFDVRDNTGGYLSAIVDVLDFILPKGKLLISFDYGNETVTRDPIYSATDEKIDLPLVVLQNQKTASAAELFAAALQHYGRATLIGEKTYGKCTMQTGYELEDGSYLTVTVANYLPPSGQSYQGKGLSPDISAPLSEAAAGTSLYLLPTALDAPLQAALTLLGTPA